MDNDQAMRPSEVTRLDFHELEKASIGPVWVFNNTKGTKRSDIMFSSARPNGTGTDTVKIPVTFLPIDLTTQVPREQLMTGAEFRRAVSGGLLKVVSDTDARGYMRSLDRESISEEKRRLRDLDATSAIQSQSTSMGHSAAEAVVRNSLDVDGVSPAVVSLMASVGEDSHQSQLNNTLRSMAESLTDTDWDHIMSEARRNKLKKTLQYAKKEKEQR